MVTVIEPQKSKTPSFSSRICTLSKLTKVSSQSTEYFHNFFSSFLCQCLLESAEVQVGRGLPFNTVGRWSRPLEVWLPLPWARSCSLSLVACPGSVRISGKETSAPLGPTGSPGTPLLHTTHLLSGAGRVSAWRLCAVCTGASMQTINSEAGRACDLILSLEHII